MKIPTFLLISAAAFAHDLYLMPGTFFPKPGTNVTIGFHSGDSFPESESVGRIDRLQDPKLFWRGGAGPIGNLRAEGKRNIGDAAAEGCAGECIAAVSTTPVLIELDPPKFTEYLKGEGLSEIVARRERLGESAKPGKERYSKYAKAILLSGAPDGYASHPVGYVIEIIPEADPYKLKPGARLPIQVLFRGKPAAGLQIETSWAAPGKQGKTTVAGRTGPDGRLKVPLAAAGQWRIHTIRMDRCEEPAVADWESFWASLTFELR